MKQFLLRVVVPIAMIGIGVFLLINAIDIYHKRNSYTKTTAVIDRIKEEYSGEDTDYDVYVTYTVDGQQYTNELGTYITGFHEGKTVRILYNPKNPNDLLYAGKSTFYMSFVFSGIALLIGVGMLLRTVVPLIMAATGKD